MLQGPLRLGLACALVLALFAARAAGAGAPTDHLRSQVDRIIKVLDDPELKQESRTTERRATIRKVATDIMDFEESAKRALGQHWNARTPAERQEFVSLFTDLLERAYITKIEQYHGEKVSYLADSVDGGQATVRTSIVTKQGTDIPVGYRMHLKDGRWLVYDVVIEGVSLVANYRTQFNKIIQTSSYKGLVERLKAKESGG